MMKEKSHSVSKALNEDDHEDDFQFFVDDSFHARLCNVIKTSVYDRAMIEEDLS